MASMASTPHPTPRPQGAEAPSLAAVDFPSGLPGARPQEKLPSRVAEQVSEELAAAIQAGNVSKAQQLATCLAVGRTRLNISFDIDSHDDKSKEQEISVTVHVEDRESAGLTLTDVKVRPSDTILDLKRTFFGKYGFPPEVQKWIIGSRICKDEETLSRCDVHTSGHTLYLYLLSARAANITREDYRRQWQGNTPGGRQRAASRPRSGDYESMRMPMMSPAAPGPPSGGQGQGGVPPLGQGQGPPPGSAARQQSQLSAASSASSLAAPSLGLSDMRGPPEPGSGQNSSEPASANRASDVRQVQGQPESAVTGAARELMATGGGEGGVDRNVLQGIPKGPPRPPRPLLQAQQAQQDPSLGWQCVTCTLINQPTRPGCEACGSPRPPDYEVPSGYVVSEEERLRLAREQQLEALMQQTSGHGWEQGQEQGGATPALPAAAQFPFHATNNNDQPLTAEQLDLILRFNDAIQQHLCESGTRNAGAHEAGGVQRGVNNPVVPSGVRQPVQNVDLGDEVPDQQLLGWVSEDENDTFPA